MSTHTEPHYIVHQSLARWRWTSGRNHGHEQRFQGV